MTTIVTDGKSEEWVDSRDFSPEQRKRTKGGELLFKMVFNDEQSGCTVFFGNPRKGMEVDWHHDADEFIYFLKGRMRVEDYDDGKTHIAKKGDLLFHKKGSRLKQIFEEDCETIAWVVPKYEPSQDLPL